MTEQEFKTEFDKLKEITHTSGKNDKRYFKIIGVCMTLVGEAATAEVPENLFEGFAVEDRQTLVVALLSGLLKILAEVE